MGILFSAHISDLAPGFILAPERYDPRRTIQTTSARTLADIAQVLTTNISPKKMPDRQVLILDTSHAFQGFVVLRHRPGSRSAVKSTKRLLARGDVIVSRLRPYLQQIAYLDDALFELVPGGNLVVSSTEFFILRGRDGFDPAALVPLLLSEPVQAALAAAQEGGHHPRFNKDTLLNLPIPATFLQNASRIAATVKQHAAGVRRALDGNRALAHTIAGDLQRATLPNDDD